ncbi:OmpA family protein [Thalassospira lucentensis]|uniref:OmpA family protein n=1 Tax=Thalassospira lucentensis TaxID=168935 RepID=A0A358HZE3_9PROT|nr:OmpA family protein [Thalassospira lucentensis]RCK28733.1 cell envelope biogenesis protein OmpA [Thalassospira lucentensis MCCC 1A00383 = DSM 14000]HBV00551.1 OmpA family protein [Thalassospira lucentensis]HCW69058.1 OmpA family protein [Thalassospira lucentensis]|tara:strand:+ start:1401 stop:2300 length:900 start_codon:yes stop_codon:yes gene_type:complete
MQFRSSVLFALGGVAMLSACSSVDNSGTAVAYGGNPLTYGNSVSSAISGQEPSTSFGKALKAEYIAYAQREADEWYDFFDADFFAKKAGKVAENETLLPEDPANWRFSDEEVAQKRAVRDELIALLDDGKREEKPETAAIAQARFDCWIEESEEGWQNDLISQCWKDFEAAMAELRKEEMATPVAAVAPKESRLFTIFFDFDSVAITPVSERVLDAAAEQWAQSMGTINVVGHADSSGAAAYNLKLSERRASAALSELTGRGIKGDSVDTDAVGEGELLIPTPDGVREPRNRRVTISVD